MHWLKSVRKVQTGAGGDIHPLEQNLNLLFFPMRQKQNKQTKKVTYWGGLKKKKYFLLYSFNVWS